MPSIIGDLFALTDDEVRSHAPAFARIAKSFGGPARYLYELVTGASAVASEAPATPANPQGLIGLDMSGPPWGSAPRHCVAWASGIKPDAALFAGQRSLADAVDDDSPAADIDFSVWVRPHEPGRRVPYSRLYLRLRAHLVSAGSTSLSVQCSTAHPGATPGRTDSLSVTSTSEATFAPNVYWDAVPGLNRLRLRLSRAVNGDPGVVVTSLSVDQVAKRSH